MVLMNSIMVSVSSSVYEGILNAGLPNPPDQPNYPLEHATTVHDRAMLQLSENLQKFGT